jgi:hypothetical protein
MLNNIDLKLAIAPQVATGATAIVGNIIDRQGYDSLTYIILLGTVAAAAVTGTVLLEHGNAANMSDALAVPDDQLVGTEALAGFDQASDNVCRKLGYVGERRYTRLTITPASNNANLPIAAVAVFGHVGFGTPANPPV